MLRKFTQKDAECIVPYFGDFGGLILPDAFSVEIHTLAEDAARILPTDEFNDCFASIVGRLPEPEIRKEGGASVVRSQAKYYIAAGHIALAACRGIVKLAISSLDDGVLRFAAAVCRDLGKNLYVALSAQQSADETLKQDLKDLGCEVDDASCAKLYDHPHMYSFQRFIGDRANTAFIADGANLGCYPFPALSGLFASRFGYAVREKLGETPAVVAATMRSGSAAVAAFRAFRDAGCRFVTVEEPICQQMYVDGYGSAILSVRPAGSSKYNHTIAAELCNMWRMAEVVRLGTENYSHAATATERALHLIAERLPEHGALLLE